jgi:hypothetical protein
VLKSVRGQVEAPADGQPAGHARSARHGNRWRSARPFAAWGAALLVAAAVLFWCYLRESQTAGVNSDGAGMALQGWDMLHGNLLLSGWWLADVTFYTFEVPLDALVEAVHGLNADVVHISAALIYMLLVLTAALLARGKARGAEGIIRALLGAGILVAPALSPGAHILLLSPDHTGIGVPILLTLLLVDRAAERWWVAVAMGALLTWAQVDDPLATYAAALPVALVCLVRVGVPLVLRRRPGWYDAGLAAAALVSVELTRLVISAIKAAGGYSMQSLTGVAKMIPSAEWGRQIHATVENVLILFGADFFDQHGFQTAIAFLHFVGVALALAGLVIGIVGIFRGADRVTQILTVGIGATLVAGTFATVTAPISGAHEIAVVLPFGAVLAGRTLGPWLSHEPFRGGSGGSSPPEQRWRRLPRITLAPVLGVAFACYLAALGYSASQPARPAPTQGLADWLTAHHLTSGLGRYWAANITTLASGGQVRVAAVTGNGQAPYPWVTRPGWYEPAQSYANFFVAAPGQAGTSDAFPEAAVRHVFGKPAREYRYGPYVIMVWNRNLLFKMLPPDQNRGVH